MQTHHPQKIDLGSDYPCPSCQHGRLSAITLTEALGCEKCQRIFVLNDSGYLLERLATTYPYHKQWKWTGHQWSLKRPYTRQWGYLIPPLTTLSLFLLGISIFAVFATVMKWGIIFAGILAVISIFSWLLLRRSDLRQ